MAAWPSRALSQEARHLPRTTNALRESCTPVQTHFFVRSIARCNPPRKPLTKRPKKKGARCTSRKTSSKPSTLRINYRPHHTRGAKQQLTNFLLRDLVLQPKEGTMREKLTDSPALTPVIGKIQNGNVHVHPRTRTPTGAQQPLRFL